MKIYYLGPEGSYSHILIEKMNIDCDYVPQENFSNIIKRVSSDENSVGLLAIENSITSSVHENIHELFINDLKIIGEASMEIELDLIGAKSSSISDIREVYSHSQALFQCHKFIEKYNFKALEKKSTSQAIQYIDNQNNKSLAAIGKINTQNYKNLKIIKKNIADVRHNITRWILVSKKNTEVFKEEKNKASYIFNLPHKPGSLANILQNLSLKKTNLSKIESRPIPEKVWEYRFWIDLEIGANKIEEIDEIMKNNTNEFTRIGFYSKGKIY